MSSRSTTVQYVQGTEQRRGEGEKEKTKREREEEIGPGIGKLQRWISFVGGDGCLFMVVSPGGDGPYLGEGEGE